MTPATVQLLQVVGVAFTIITGCSAAAAAWVALKISAQLAELRAEIAEKYVSKEDLRTFNLPQTQRKAAAHA